MRTTFTLFIGLIAFGYIAAQPAGYKTVKDKDAVLKRIAATAQKTTTISSSFKQEKYLDILDDKIISNGRFLFSQPRSLRWEYTDPFSYIIIIHNNKIVFKDENKTNTFDANSNEIFKHLNDLIINLVQGTLISDDKFGYKLFEGEKEYLITLKPKDENIKKLIPEIEMHFSKSDFQLRTLKMIEVTGDYTKIKFLDRKINTKLASNAFNI
ncbi:MAG: outer membrane lipoprotein carrier protein LolA [Bacteroidales bacterium]|jgi:outer membrane lipoprotein-sorting protein|nr:outer membrane lipoprotein carrier protein LolA [Bacteroidales bacterium]